MDYFSLLQWFERRPTAGMSDGRLEGAADGDDGDDDDHGIGVGDDDLDKKND